MDSGQIAFITVLFIAVAVMGYKAITTESENFRKLREGKIV